MPLPRAVALDVNETLLDLAGLDPVFARLFGQAAVRQEWFGTLLQSALVSAATGHYTDFTSTALAALEAVAARHGRTLGDAERAAVREGMQTLPAHPDVAPAIRRLREAGVAVIALTNGTREAARAQLGSAGLLDLLSDALSADDVQVLKPAPAPYRHAAERLGVSVGQLWMVAAHGWDIRGAAAAGCRTAFVARPGAQLDPLCPHPDLAGPDLGAIADQLLAS